MRKPLMSGMVAAIVGLALVAPGAEANERLLTLYSPKIDSLPYVHDTHQVALSADGRAAPAKPGYILGFKEMALVDSKDPNAKPLPIAKMMVHHFLYFAPGRVDQGWQLLAGVRIPQWPRRGAPARADAADPAGERAQAVRHQ